MQLDAEVFMALLRRLLPRVYKHLQQVGVGPLLYLPEWFLCLFTRSLPFPIVLRIWDAFLSEGELGMGAEGIAHGSEFVVLVVPTLSPFGAFCEVDLSMSVEKTEGLTDTIPE